MTHLIQLTRGVKWVPKDSTYPEWGPEGPGPSSPCTERREKHDSNIVPFRATRLAVYTHLLLNVMWSKRFLSYLILTLSWCLMNKIISQWEKFAPSYNPLFRVSQITILIWRVNIVHDVTNVEQHELFGADASRPLPDVAPEQVNPLAVVKGVQSRFF